MRTQEHILDYLAREIHCEFLSNLTSPIYRREEMEFFSCIPMERYPLADWQYAYHYIFGVQSQATTLPEMRDDFLKILSFMSV